MPVSKNTWIKGLNSDLSKLKSQPDSYLDGKNIRVITDEGTSTFAVENIRGNKFDFKLPTVEATWFITVPNNVSGTGVLYFGRNDVMIVLSVDNIQNKSNETICNDLNQAVIDFFATLHIF